MITQEEKEKRKQDRLDKDYIYPWVGFDLDKCLAVYDTYVDETHIGEPIPKMVERVKQYLAERKYVVKIFTARASEQDPAKLVRTLNAIAAWSQRVFGVSLAVTCIKDYGCIRIYDDRAVGVQENTGELMTDVAWEDGYEVGLANGRSGYGGE